MKKGKVIKLSPAEQKALLAAVKENPNVKVYGTQKSLQLGYNDLPLFYEDKQTKLFE